MKTTNLFCYLAIILLLVPTARGEVPTADYDRLDSILLTGDPEAAIAYWSTVCSPATEDSSAAACTATAEQLQNLIEYVALFKTQKQAYIEAVLTEARNQSAKYKESYAGPSAARAFELFLDALSSDDRLKAITYLRTARFFKIPFLKKRLAEAHSNYGQADKLFGEGNFDSADSILKAIRYDAGNNPALLAYADTISYLQQRVDRKFDEIEKRQFYWERTASVPSRFSISLASLLLSQPGSDAFPLVMSRGNSTIEIEVERISPTYRFGLGAQAWYRLNERTSVGVGVDAARLVYSSRHTQQLIFFDFDVAYTRAFVGGQYMLRSEVGLRPYLNFGLGVMRLNFDPTDVAVHVESGGFVTYQVAGDDFRSGEATFTVGTQFVPKSSSRWAYASEISWYHPFKEHTFLPLPRLSIGVRIDYLM